jgi:hypothetical protein
MSNKIIEEMRQPAGESQYIRELRQAVDEVLKDEVVMVLPVNALDIAIELAQRRTFKALDQENRNNALLHTWSDQKPITPAPTRSELAKKRR